MDDFLNTMREPPRPAFAQALRLRLAEADGVVRRRAVRARMAQAAGALAVALGVILALNPRAPIAHPSQATSETQPAASALLLPVTKIRANRPAASTAWSRNNTPLRVPPVAISHHN